MNAPPFLRRLKPGPLLLALAALALFFAGWWFGLPPREPSAAAGAAASEIWTCSMHPQIRQPAPGLCPICNMDLIPLEGGPAGSLREVSVSPEAAALLDLRVAPVVREPAVAEVELFGRIDYDERRVTTITTRVAGRLDRLFVDFTGAVVREGDHLAEIYSPDLLVAQRELIEARRALGALDSGTSPAVRDTRQRLLQAARERLRLLQFDEQQIQRIERSDEPEDRLTLNAPQSGVVTAKLVSEGQYVNTGDPLFRVADLSSVWLRLEAYEDDLQWLRYGQDVAFRVRALPGRTFHGRIAFIDPEIDPMRRIARVRVNVENPDQALKPGMFAEATVRSATAASGQVLDPELAGKWISPMHPEIVKDGPGQCDICGMDLVPAEELGFIADADAAPEPLLVPASAVLRTGRRAIVYVRIPDEGEPTFEGREIVLGPRVGDRFIVEAGLREGELVVTQGAFKLDSELQIQAKPSMMSPNAGLEERPALEGPESLAGQWPPVRRALHRLLGHPEPGAVRAVGAAVAAVDTSQLQPEELDRWREFSRRILNEVAVSADEAAAQPERAAERVAAAVDEAGRFLGLPGAPLPPPPVDPAAAAGLRKLLDAYFPLARQLAEDDDDGAREAAATLAATAETTPLDEAADLPELARAVATADGIKSRRAALEPLSQRLIALVRGQGTDAVGDAYVVHCPMAFGNQGADWLAEAPVVINPYFGDAMLTCGTVTDTLSLESPEPAALPDAPAPADPHEGHDH